MTDAVAVAVLCIAVAGMAAQWLAWKIRLPAIVLLFMVGLVFGPALHILQPARDFGPALPALVGLAVAIVCSRAGSASTSASCAPQARAFSASPPSPCRSASRWRRWRRGC